MDILESLSSNVRNLEQYYLDVASQYPPVLDYLQNHIHAIEDRLYRENRAVDKKSMSAWQQEKNRQLKEIQSQKSRIVNMINSLVSEGMEKAEDIHAIREHVQDLELYSLNAMVSAVKSGKNAGAFPYLTKEMQKTAIQSFQTSDRLYDEGQQLIAFFRKTNEQIQETTQNQTAAISEIKNSVNEVIEEISCYSSDSEKYLSQMKQLHQSLREPINQIISEVQKQDIFRQSIDHILFAFGHCDNFPMKSLEDELNYLKYNFDVHEFSLKVVDEILTSLSESIGTFENCHEEISVSIPKLNDICHLNNDLNISVSRLAEDINEKLAMVENNSYEAAMDMGPLNQFVKEIMKHAQALESLLGKIDMINISNRIEMTRNNEVYGIEQSISNIDQSARKIAAKISDIGGYTKNASQNMSEAMDEYKKISEDCRDFLRGFLNKIQEDTALIAENAQALVKHSEELQSFRESFRDLDRNLISDIGKTKKVEQELTEIENYLFEQSSMFRNRFETLLEKCEYQTWTVEIDEVREILEKFSTFTGRQMISDETLTETQSALNGEIVLF